jgi:NADH dehydrogenase FAD-containing subunit
MMEEKKKRIVVPGGGFAGVNFVKRLANDERFFVTLVGKNNFHSFTPLLYQVVVICSFDTYHQFSQQGQGSLQLGVVLYNQ